MIKLIHILKLKKKKEAQINMIVAPKEHLSKENNFVHIFCELKQYSSHFKKFGEDVAEPYYPTN